MKFCMACESREDDPSQKTEFVLQCPVCNYWLCKKCKDQLIEVDRYNCLNCDTKFIANIIEFVPKVSKKEGINLIEDLLRDTYKGEYSKSMKKGFTDPTISGTKPFKNIARKVSLLSADTYKDIPVKKTIKRRIPGLQEGLRELQDSLVIENTEDRFSADDDINMFDRSAGEAEAYTNTILNIENVNVSRLKAWWNKTKKRLRKDPHYLPIVQPHPLFDRKKSE